MIEYGYIDSDGFLRAKALEPITFNEKNPETGAIENKVITVEDQIKDLPPGWKPLDQIDDDMIRNVEEGYVVRTIPYDAGDRISYHYETVPDLQGMRAKIEVLKGKLSDTDYQVIKCYEASLIGNPMPYDVATLHASRQELRNQINALENIQANMIQQ